MAFVNHKPNHHINKRNHGRNHLSTNYIAIQSQYCTSCGTCIKECPRGVIGKIHFFAHEHAHIDNADDCIGCKKCVHACPNKAIIELTNNVRPRESVNQPAEIHEFHKSIPDELRKPNSRDWANTIVDLLR